MEIAIGVFFVLDSYLLSQLFISTQSFPQIPLLRFLAASGE